MLHFKSILHLYYC